MNFITDNCVNISAYASNSKMAADLDKWAIVRNETLNRCYAIPGYAEKSTDEKCKIYDMIKATVTKEIFKEA